MKITHAFSTLFHSDRKHGNGTVGLKIRKTMIVSWSQLLWAVLFFLKISAANSADSEDTRRPIWNVAHMVNSLWQVDYYLDKGANSLEFDIAFDWQGNAKFTFHGVPCDCFRTCMRYEDFDTYIEYMQILTTPGNENFREELVLLFLDLKVSGLSPTALTHAGENLATKLLDLYWKRRTSGAQAYVLLSMPSVNHFELVRSFIKTLQADHPTFYNDKIGFDFSGNEDLSMIHSVLNDVQISEQIWQGDGITNCLPRGTRRLLEAIDRRDEMQSAYVDKVYWWTVDKMSTMRRTLNLGVDGMITNYPHRLVEVLNEDEFSKVARLANINDNPWKKYPRRMSSLISILPRARGGNFTAEDTEEEILYNS